MRNANSSLKSNLKSKNTKSGMSGDQSLYKRAVREYIMWWNWESGQFKLQTPEKASKISSRNSEEGSSESTRPTQGKKADHKGYRNLCKKKAGARGAAVVEEDDDLEYSIQSDSSSNADLLQSESTKPSPLTYSKEVERSGSTLLEGSLLNSNSHNFANFASKVERKGEISISRKNGKNWNLGKKEDSGVVCQDEETQKDAFDITFSKIENNSRTYFTEDQIPEIEQITEEINAFFSKFFLLRNESCFMHSEIQKELEKAKNQEKRRWCLVEFLCAGSRRNHAEKLQKQLDEVVDRVEEVFTKFKSHKKKSLKTSGCFLEDFDNEDCPPLTNSYQFVVLSQNKKLREQKKMMEKAVDWKYRLTKRQRRTGVKYLVGWELGIRVRLRASPYSFQRSRRRRRKEKVGLGRAEEISFATERVLKGEKWAQLNYSKEGVRRGAGAKNGRRRASAQQLGGFSGLAEICEAPCSPSPRKKTKKGQNQPNLKSSCWNCQLGDQRRPEMPDERVLVNRPQRKHQRYPKHQKPSKIDLFLGLTV